MNLGTLLHVPDDGDGGDNGGGGGGDDDDDAQKPPKVPRRPMLARPAPPRSSRMQPEDVQRHFAFSCFHHGKSEELLTEAGRTEAPIAPLESEYYAYYSRPSASN